MVDDFYRNLALRGWVEGTALRGVQGRPGGLVNLGSEGALEFFVGLLGAAEIGVADLLGLMLDSPQEADVTNQRHLLQSLVQKSI